MAGDKAYDAFRIPNWCRKKKIRCVIPQRKGWRPGQQKRCRLDRASYRKRNVVERSIGSLKHCRRVATWYEKLAIHYFVDGEVSDDTAVFAVTGGGLTNRQS